MSILLQVAWKFTNTELVSMHSISRRLDRLVKQFKYSFQASFEFWEKLMKANHLSKSR